MKYLKRFNESSSNPEYSNIDITGENFMEIFENTIRMSEREIDQISDIWENSGNNRKVRISDDAIGLFHGNACEASIGKLDDDWFILYDTRVNSGNDSTLWKCDTINGLLSKIMEIWGHN